MKIDLTWANYNGGTEDSVVVYRDSSPIPDNPITPPLATLPPGSTSYSDTTVTRGAMYYYRVAITKDGVTKIDKNRAIVAILPSETGPGPQTIISGDWNMGYFGLARSADFITYLAASDMMDTAKTIGGTTPSNNDIDWVKIAYKGKVLFIPRGIFRYAVLYKNLYLNGLVYGTNDTGLSVPSGTAATNQYRPLNIKNFTFIPRLLQGLQNTATNVPATTNNNSYLTTNPGSNEWDDITGALNNGQPSWSTDTNAASNSIASMRDEFGPFVTVSTHVTDHCQQPTSFTDKASSLLRGGRYCNGTAGVWFSGTALAIPVINGSVSVNQFAGQASTVTVYPCWRPVLELVF